MNYPKHIDLEVINNTMWGGEPEDIIKTLNLKKKLFRFNKKIIQINTTESYKYEFLFNKRNVYDKNMKQHFFAHGGITAIYGIYLKNPNINKDTLHMLANKDKLILRIVQENDFDITQYSKDKTKYNIHIIDIFFHGSIKIDNETYYYQITREYYNHTHIKTLNVHIQLNLLENFMLLLKNIYDNKECYNDLKFENIGFEYINKQITFIILDYDSNTLSNTSRTYFMPLFIDKCRNNDSHQYDIIYHIGGLLNVICNIFNKNLLKISEQLISFQKIISDMYAHPNCSVNNFNLIHTKINTYVEDNIIRSLLSNPNNLISYLVCFLYPALLTNKEHAYKTYNYLLTNLNLLKYLPTNNYNNFILDMKKLLRTQLQLPPPGARQTMPLPPPPPGARQTMPLPPPPVIAGGNIDYKQKYLKYKQKYLICKQKYLEL